LIQLVTSLRTCALGMLMDAAPSCFFYAIKIDLV
jgi:hypothetical protein